MAMGTSNECETRVWRLGLQMSQGWGRQNDADCCHVSLLIELCEKVLAFLKEI
jgi:hypothetical protein